MDHKYVLRDEAGFSLIEVLCSVVILSILAAIVLQTVQLASRNMAAAQEKTLLLAVVPELILTLREGAADGSTPSEGIVDNIRWEATPIQSNQDAPDRQLLRLRVFTSHGDRYFDFLVRPQPDRP